jgi:integrase
VQLQGVLRCAVEWRRIGHNPVKSVKKPKVRRYREVRPLSPLIVERLRVAAAGRRRKHGPRDAALLAVLAYAGLRPQEAQALRWSDVRERTLLVEKAADGQGGVKTTKTGQARTVRLLAPLAADLAEWRLRCPHDGDDDLLFPNRSGGVWNDGAWQSWHRDAWHPACCVADIENARPYDLRHSFVSLLIHEGRSVVDVARQAGRSPTMTLDVYAHVFDEFDIAERVSAEDQVARRGAMCPNRVRLARTMGRRSRKSLLIPTTRSACRGSPSSPRRCRRRSGPGGRRGRLALCRTRACSRSRRGSGGTGRLSRGRRAG